MDSQEVGQIVHGHPTLADRIGSGIFIGAIVAVIWTFLVLALPCAAPLLSGYLLVLAWDRGLFSRLEHCFPLRGRWLRYGALPLLFAFSILGVGAILAVPAVSSARSYDGTLAARVYSPGLLPRVLSEVEWNGRTLQTTPNYTLVVRDLTTGESVTLFSVTQDCDPDRFWQPGPLHWSTDGNELISHYSRTFSRGNQMRYRLSRNPLRAQELKDGSQ